MCTIGWQLFTDINVNTGTHTLHKIRVEKSEEHRDMRIGYKLA